MWYSGPPHFVGDLLVAICLGRPQGTDCQERIVASTQSAISSWGARFHSTVSEVFATSPWLCLHRSYTSIWRSWIEARRTWSWREGGKADFGASSVSTNWRSRMRMERRDGTSWSHASKRLS